MDDLVDFSEDEQTPQETPEETAPPETPAEPEQVAAETPEVEAEATPEQAEETPAQASTEPPPGLLGERHRRQAAELAQRQAEFELQQFKAQQQTPQQAQTPVDYFDDPRAAVTQQLDQSVTPQIDSIRQEMINNKLNMSEQFAIQQHGAENFQAASTLYLQSIENDPQKIQAFMDDPNPAQLAFSEGQRMQELEKFGGDMSKRDEAIKAQAIAEYQASLKASANLTKDVPGSLSQKPSSAPDKSQPVPDGPLIDTGGYALDS